MKIDHRKNYILMLDTETANTISTDRGLDMTNVLVYDIGYQVIDKYGNVYHRASFVNSDIFINERSLMKTAYYAKKIPQYVKDIRAGTRKLATYYEIRQAILNIITLYNINIVCAHNTRFDANAVNVTQRYETKSKYRYFFPFGIEFWDTMKMAEDVICTKPTYIKFCEKHNYFTASGKPRKTAETLYRFISGDNQFVESHTGLEDVQIETKILAYCFRQKKAMRKRLYENPLEHSPQTPIQKRIMHSVRKHPVMRVNFV